LVQSREDDFGYVPRGRERRCASYAHLRGLSAHAWSPASVSICIRGLAPSNITADAEVEGFRYAVERDVWQESAPASDEEIVLKKGKGVDGINVEVLHPGRGATEHQRQPEAENTYRGAKDGNG